MGERLRQGLRATGLCLLVVLVVVSQAWAGPINKDQLKPGMTLTETINTFGQPLQMEWLNVSGQAMLFMFYESETCALCLEAVTGQDVIVQPDGRVVIPLGFTFNGLSGWGKKYYEGVKLPSR